MFLGDSLGNIIGHNKTLIVFWASFTKVN